MKHIFTVLSIGGLLVALTSCSCGIYRDEFVSSDRRTVLTDQLVERAAIANWFSVGLPEDGHARFMKDDVELIHDHVDQRIVVRSSICLGDSEKWQSNCEAVSNKLVETFGGLGIPLRKLSTEEQLRIGQGKGR